MVLSTFDIEFTPCRSSVGFFCPQQASIPVDPPQETIGNLLVTDEYLQLVSKGAPDDHAATIPGNWNFSVDPLPLLPPDIYSPPATLQTGCNGLDQTIYKISDHNHPPATRQASTIPAAQPIAATPSAPSLGILQSHEVVSTDPETVARKRQRNTLAARKYRQKRLDRIMELEQALHDMTQQRDDLKLQLARQEAETKALREMMGGRR
ncbi:hypothetical protein H2199_003885 [Coniosporium tulheliwenetii]|uniref:Uncharacterized protein n=1 Tax=Coniosporium tulheliwenetii TaxID=3383036 RepID=A0ACC2Z9S4_9PEZI|nr:hypothetical protein H2199_003885 [Cladosporium sp. JES 115]